MKRRLTVLLAALVVTVTVFGQTRDSAQSGEPTTILTGTLYDINGAVLVTATRIVANSTHGKKFEAATNDEGIYKIKLPLGVYTLEARAPGLCPARLEQFRVVRSTEGKMYLDLVLEVSGTIRECTHVNRIKKRSQRRPKTPGSIARVES